MSLQQELFSSCAKLVVYELKEGFRAAAHIPDISYEDVMRKVENRFLRVWNLLALQNTMFLNQYNMRGLI